MKKKTLPSEVKWRNFLTLVLGFSAIYIYNSKPWVSASDNLGSKPNFHVILEDICNTCLGFLLRKMKMVIIEHRFCLGLNMIVSMMLFA